jgi:hypothetical protein
VNLYFLNNISGFEGSFCVFLAAHTSIHVFEGSYSPLTNLTSETRYV